RKIDTLKDRTRISEDSSATGNIFHDCDTFSEILMLRALSFAIETGFKKTLLLRVISLLIVTGFRKKRVLWTLSLEDFLTATILIIESKVAVDDLLSEVSYKKLDTFAGKEALTVARIKIKINFAVDDSLSEVSYKK